MLWIRRSRVVALVAVAGLLLVACGGGDKKTSAATTTAEVTVPADATKVTVTVGETDLTHQYMKASSVQIPAGTVSFEVVNEGKKKHEMIVLNTPTKAADLEYDADKDRIVEEEGTVVDEAEDVEAGTSAILNVDLDAGHYVLVCNIKGHYRMGMVTDLQVS